MKDSEKTNFGFKSGISFKEKTKLVNDVFSSVASKYDIMNDFMSLGIHRIWKKKFVEQIEVNEGDEILDLACGTADISITIKKRLQKSNINAHITVSDINADMLKLAKEKFIDENLYSNVTFKQINAEEIPLKNNSLDIITISFGIRNVANIQNGLNEAFRTLKKGGKFYVMEFTKLEEDGEFYKKYLSKFYEAYSLNILPKLGKLIAKDEESYRYLAESIKTFPFANQFKQMLLDTGFENVSCEKQLGQGVSIFCAVK